MRGTCVAAVQKAYAVNLAESALRRPMTVVVAVVAVLCAALLALQQTARDIFPNLGTPTIYVAQPFGGMDPAQMEGYLTYYYEYHFLYITGIEHVESKSIQGNALINAVLSRYRHGTGHG
jgi:multidrug efflux pump subunit AcrB